MTPDQHFRRFTRDAALLRELLADGDLGAPVPGCPGWDLADLGGHVGGVYRFAATAIAEDRVIDEPAGPRKRAELLDWFDTGTARLRAALAGGDWLRPCRTMWPPANHGFWARRMCHETAIHLSDARRSQGAGAGIDSALAADGVHEIVTMFFPRQVRLGRIPALTDALEIRIDDAPTADRLVLAGDGTGTGGADPDAVLSGRAEPLLFLLWKRMELTGGDFTITGEQDAARRVLATAITP